MSITVDWDKQDRTIILMKYAGAWDWNAHYEAVRQAREIGDSIIPQRVDVIVNALESANPPIGSAMSNITATLRVNRPTNLGILVLVTHNPFVETLMRVAPKVYPRIGNSLVLADTVDEARAKIQIERQKVSHEFRT
jgi:hypothetical protein